MLYDKRWDAKVQADPFSLESLIAWLEKQAPDTQYDYCRSDSCLVAQYLFAMGVKDYVIGDLDKAGLGHFDLVSNCWHRGGMTFGAALERARKALAVAGGSGRRSTHSIALSE